MSSRRPSSRSVRSAVNPVGTFQCELPRALNRVHLAFVHHPPTWIRDWGAVESLLRKRAHILLFGHEHAFAARQLPKKTFRSYLLANLAAHQVAAMPVLYRLA